jgi:phage-related minor tail protein
MSDAAGIAVVVGVAALALLAEEYRIRQLREERNMWRKHAREAAKLHDQAAAQRDRIAQDLADLRARYVDIAGLYRHLALSRLAQGVGMIRVNRN